MKQLRRNEFIDMLEMAEILYEATEKFIKCDIPSLGAVTYYPKADKLQIDKTNTWVELGFEYVKTILKSTTKNENPIQQATSLVKVREVKSEDELRDEFAGLAMQGVCVNAGRNTFKFDDAESIADYAYLIADAMLKRRK